jgi:hypothetical protein
MDRRTEGPCCAADRHCLFHSPTLGLSELMNHDVGDVDPFDRAALSEADVVGGPEAVKGILAMRITI